MDDYERDYVAPGVDEALNRAEDAYNEELDNLRSALDYALTENKRLRAIIARIDKVTPRADDTCDEPGIKLSTAVRRTLRNEGHPLFRKEPPSPSPR